jgi:hypothetical protein
MVVSPRASRKWRPGRASFVIRNSQAGRSAVIAVILYIKRQCLWLDLKLIALSFWIAVRGKWEYRGRKF